MLGTFCLKRTASLMSSVFISVISFSLVPRHPSLPILISLMSGIFFFTSAIALNSVGMFLWGNSLPTNRIVCFCFFIFGICLKEGFAASCVTFILSSGNERYSKRSFFVFSDTAIIPFAFLSDAILSL